MRRLTKDGKFTRVPDSLLQQYLDNGWDFAEGEVLDTETGQRKVAPEDVRSEISAGGTLTGKEELRSRAAQQFREEKFSGGLEGLQAFGEGGISALTFGLVSSPFSDDAEAAARAQTRSGLSTAGQLTGLAVGGLAGGLPSSSSRLVNLARMTPAGLAGRASALARPSGLVVEGAVEGALFGGGQAFANAALQNKPLSAEAILSDMGSGALYGGIIGGIGVGLGKWAGRVEKNAVLRKFDDSLDETLRSATTSDLAALRTSFDDAINAVKPARISTELREASDFTDLIAQKQKHIDELTDQLAAINKKTSPGSYNSVEARLVKTRRELAEAKTTGKEFMAKLQATEKANSAAAAQEIASLKAGQQVLKTLGEDGSHVIGKLGLKDPASALQLANKLDDAAGVLASKGIQVPELQLGKALDDAGRTVDNLREMAKAANLSDETLAVLDNLKPGAPSEALLKAWVMQRVTKQIKSGGSGSGGLLRGIFGGAVRGPGGQFGGIVGNMVRAVGNTTDRIAEGVAKFVRRAGKFKKGYVPAASAILGRVKFDAELGEKPDLPKFRHGSKTQLEFRARADELNRAMANPAKTQAAIRQRLAPIAQADPNIGAMLYDRALAKLKYLYDAMPKPPSRAPLGPDRWHPSDTELSKFTRIVAAAEDPLSLLDDMNHDRLTIEAVKTVQSLYPEVFAEMQAQIMENLPDLKAKATYNDRIQLGIMFQIPTDVVLQPHHIQAFQAAYANAEQGQQQPQGNYSTPAQVGSGEGVTSNMTTSQKLESK